MKIIHKVICFLCIFLTWKTSNGNYNVIFKNGIGYIEHYSIGTGLNFLDKHTISLNFGSNFFMHIDDFSSYLIQYDYTFTNNKIKFMYPRLIIKGGYSIYSNYYYKWELLSLAPNIGITYPLNHKLSLNFDTGISINREISMQRINMGEIGWYKRVLPELKIEILLKL